MSSVRLQWDPDHDPCGNKLERRAIQIGLPSEALLEYTRDWIVNIEDISGCVTEQRAHGIGHGSVDLLTPQEDGYPVSDPDVAQRLGLDRH